jgi:glycosyltransferase involved in cell wall biosynthesis
MRNQNTPSVFYMSLPLVSVVIPIFNQNTDFLRQCLDSVLGQTYTHLEVVVSDNHSTNEVPIVLNTYQDKRLKIVKPPQHLPITPHFQWASEQATGEYISFLGSDDWFEPTCIQELVKMIDSDPHISMAFCNQKLYGQGKLTDFIYLKSGIFPSETEFQDYFQFKKMKGNTCGGIFRYWLYQKVGGIGDGNLTYAADKWLMIQMAAQGDVAYTNECLAVFRVDHPSRGSRIVVYIDDTIRLYELLKKKYLEKVKGGGETIEREKKRMAFEFLGAIPQNLKSHEINENQFDIALKYIEILSDTTLVNIICNFFEKRQLIGVYSKWYFLSTKWHNVLLKLQKIF